MFGEYQTDAAVAVHDHQPGHPGAGERVARRGQDEVLRARAAAARAVVVRDGQGGRGEVGPGHEVQYAAGVGLGEARQGQPAGSHHRYPAALEDLPAAQATTSHCRTSALYGLHVHLMTWGNSQERIQGFAEMSQSSLNAPGRLAWFHELGTAGPDLGARGRAARRAAERGPGADRREGGAAGRACPRPGCSGSRRCRSSGRRRSRRWPTPTRCGSGRPGRPRCGTPPWCPTCAARCARWTRASPNWRRSCPPRRRTTARTSTGRRVSRWTRSPRSSRSRTTAAPPCR